MTLGDVPHSARELQALVERITADHGYWQAQGVALRGWGRGSSSAPSR